MNGSPICRHPSMSEPQIEEQESGVREQDKYLPTANIARIMKKVRAIL